MGTVEARRDGMSVSPFEIDAISIPAGELTGDFYFASEIDGWVWFAVGNVAGKGRPAAVFTAMIQEELERLTRPLRGRSSHRCTTRCAESFPPTALRRSSSGG